MYVTFYVAINPDNGNHTPFYATNKLLFAYHSEQIKFEGMRVIKWNFNPGDIAEVINGTMAANQLTSSFRSFTRRIERKKLYVSHLGNQRKYKV